MFEALPVLCIILLQWVRSTSAGGEIPIDFDDASGTYRVTSAQLSDSGTYTCRARSSTQASVSDFRLVIVDRTYDQYS